MGKISVAVEIKSDGNLFYEIIRNKPFLIPKFTPILHDCTLHKGEWGTIGCIIMWHNFYDGKITTDKELVTDIDDDKKMIAFKYLEGQLLEQYRTFNLSVGVDTKGEKDMVTWTIEFEKLNEDIHDPDFMLEVFQNITNHIDEAQIIKP